MNPFNDPTRDPRALPPAQAGLEVAQGRLPMLPEPQTLYGVPVEKETHFWDYWQVVSRRRWTILCVFLGTLLAATLYTFTIRPVFTGTVSLRIEKEPPRVVKFEEVVKEADNQQDYYQTQYKILQSRSLANRVIGLLQLDQHEEARGKLGESETHLSNYLNSHGILFVTADRLGQPQDIITQQLTLMSEAFLRARADRMAKESLLTQASVQDAFTLPAVLQSPLIAQLKTDGAALEGEYRRISQTFKPDYPRMLALKE